MGNSNLSIRSLVSALDYLHVQISDFQKNVASKTEYSRYAELLQLILQTLTQLEDEVFAEYAISRGYVKSSELKEVISEYVSSSGCVKSSELKDDEK